ncbi:SDR family oxidoreductase [Geomonas sp. RF6]|uniref:NAD-dependent epimerase/dehydratase family protein n=1 Tax=Geomonas sp. RF6 TaxID=2897342 RepID=UPI001E31C17B|nr:SDR family oxidoreductase [Geomonas sp. RF6]UFS71045.1 SDR family oxidoreductase [Geomonas sp. RF6]
MKIVVTGALGHIGSRLIREIPAALPGAHVVMLDDLSTQRYCSLFDLPVQGSYSFHEADVLTEDLAPLFAGASAVVHLAAITNAAGSFQNPEAVEQVNYRGTERVARGCIEAGVPLILLSTTSVYGTQADVVDEDCTAEALQPQSPYAGSKLRAERLVERLGREEGLSFVTLRFGTIFGISPGMRFHTAINKFCWQAVMGQPITVWRTALNQYRPYLDVVDGVEALLFVIKKELYDRRVYNVVTVNTSVAAITEIIRSYVPGISIAYVDTRIMNQLSYHVSGRRFLEAGFSCKGDLERGIRDTIARLQQATAAATPQEAA